MDQSQPNNSIFRGSCASREKTPLLEGAPDEENYVYASECRLKLHEVSFPVFQGAIKRFGYSIDLNDAHMTSISKEIKLDVKEMNTDNNSAYAIVYKDEAFFFKQKRHTVSALVKLGFLCCKHTIEENQETDLWHLINPKLEDFVTRDAVEQFLKDLIYIAVDMNKSKLNS